MKQVKFWDEYYSERRADQTLVPSQFAVFFANEVDGRIDGILDVGCGNGRDARFFAGIGYSVVGIDSSPGAIELCRLLAESLPDPERARARYVNSTAIGSGIASGLECLMGLGAEKIAVYARFLLHAVDEAAEADLLQSVLQAGSRVALLGAEFRTHHDRNLPKSTPDHYRRFIDPSVLVARAVSIGYSVEYRTEGVGLAKFRTDDAHVSRVMLVPPKR